MNAALAAIGEMGEDDVLAAAAACADTIRAAEAELLHLAYQWAILHHPDRLDPTESGLPGREKGRRYGGDGTPEVCEFAAAELGARIGRSPYAAAALMADGRISWSRFEALVEAKIAQADPETARAKEEAASKATFARKVRAEAHGMGTFMVRADIATIDQIGAAVTAGEASLVEAMPFSSSLSRTKQIDHTVAYDEGGESGVGNYGPMTRFHHRIKTHGDWQVKQPFPGIYIWRDPHGARYLVDHTGTRRLRGDPTQPPPQVIEIWRTTDTHLELDWPSSSS